MEKRFVFVQVGVCVSDAAVRYSVLQCVAVCCSVLQCVITITYKSVSFQQRFVLVHVGACSRI